MSYIPRYSEEKLDSLRKYVESFKRRNTEREELAASIVTEMYRAMVSRRRSDGDERYTFFNNLLFNGELPQSVKVYFVNSKNNKSKSNGFDTEERRRSYKDLISDKDRTLGAWYESSNAIYIFIDRVGAEDFVIDTVLVHEMCHVWQDRVYKGGRNISAHSSPFQYAKSRTQKRSNGIYDGGAYIDISKKDKQYKRGVFGNPGLGKTQKQTEDYYKKIINQKLKKTSHKGLIITDISKKEFEYLNKVFVFYNGKLYSDGNIGKTLANALNKDEELINFLSYAFNQIKNKRGI